MVNFVDVDAASLKVTQHYLGRQVETFKVVSFGRHFASEHTARRTIQFDVFKVKQLAAQLGEEAVTKLQRALYAGRPINEQIADDREAFASSTLMLPNVKGKGAQVKIQVKGRKGRSGVTSGGHYLPGQVVMYINTDYPPDLLDKNQVANEFGAILVHEVTHALDVVSKKYVNLKDDERSYFNQPTEFRAYAKQVITEALVAARSRAFKFRDMPISAKLIEELLKKSKSYQKHNLEMNWDSSNHKRLRQMLVRELEDQRTSKTARAIRLDKQSIKELAKHLETYLARKHPHRPWGDKMLLKGDPFGIKAVDGSPLTVYIQLRSRVSDNVYYVLDAGLGYAQGHPVVVVFLNGSLDIPKNTGGVLTNQLYAVLIHELTHAADKFAPKGVADQMTQEEAQGNAAYYNHPAEVRAYMQEVVDEVEDKFKHWDKLEKSFGPGKGMTYLMNMSNTWGEISPHLTERNRRLIIKTVSQALADYRTKNTVVSRYLQMV